MKTKKVKVILSAYTPTPDGNYEKEFKVVEVEMPDYGKQWRIIGQVTGGGED